MRRSTLLPAIIAIFLLSARAAFAQHADTLTSLEIIGAHRISQAEITGVLHTRVGNVFDEATFEADMDRLLAQYAALGYAFARVRPSSLERSDSTHVRITLRVNEGPRAHLVRVVPVGIAETDTDVIAREFLVHSAPPLSRELLDAGVSRLRQGGLFARVGEPQLFAIGDSTVGITIALSESRTTSLDGVLGYVPSPAPGSSAYVNGFLDLAFLNIGGSARAARLRYDRLTPNTSDLAATYREPWIAGLPIDAELSISRHDQDSEFVASDAALRATLHSIAGIGIEASARYSGITPGRANLVDGSHTISGGIAFSADRRDDRIAPRRGYFVSLGATYGSKTTTDSLGYAAIASVRSLSAEAEAAMAIAGERIVGVVKVSAQEVSSSAIDLSDLYRVGGIRSLRGYREASFVASRYIIGSVEPRFHLSKRSYIGAFVDVGGLEQVAYSSQPDRKWSALGYGISMLFDTQIGYVQGAVALARGVPLDAAVLQLGLRTAF